MTTIDQLGGTEHVKDSDLIPIFQLKNRRTRNVSAVDLADYVDQKVSDNYAPKSHVGSTGVSQHGLVVDNGDAGFMSGAQSAKLSGIQTGAQNNTAVNLGSGAGVFKDKTGSSINLRSLVAGGNVAITQGANEITISANANDFLNTLRINVASASTVNLTTAAPNTRNINITGGNSISAFTVAAGMQYFVRFDARITLVSGASIVTQTGSDLQLGQGDTCVLRATAANVVEVTLLSRNGVVGILDSLTDLDAIQAPGAWPALVGGAAGSRNANFPDGQAAPAIGSGVANFYWIEVKRYAANLIQVAYPYISGADTTIATIKYRMLGGGVWSAWRTIPNTASIPITKRFVSAQQTITAGGSLTIAHGLGAAPVITTIEFVCVAADAGYAIGDRIQRYPGAAGIGGGSSVEVWPDATNLNIRFGSLAFNAANKTTGAQTALTLTSWRAVFGAFS